MEYLRNDYYRREYENAAALDVKGTAEGLFRTVWIYGKAIIGGTDRKL